MSTPSVEKKAPGVLLCVVVFLCVCAAVGVVNVVGASGDRVAVHKSTATALTCTPPPAGTPSAVPAVSLADTAAVLPTPPEAAAATVSADVPDVAPDVPVTGTWVLNTSTKRFHLPGCGSVPTIKETNRGDFTGERDELIERGYKPCGNCKP